MIELNASNNRKENYKIKAIWNIIVYIRELKLDYHLPELYNLVLWKYYQKKEYLEAFICS